jgi:hypothetical protein
LIPRRDREQILVDLAAAVDLTHAFILGMVARGAGAIVLHFGVRAELRVVDVRAVRVGAVVVMPFARTRG